MFKIEVGKGSSKPPVACKLLETKEGIECLVDGYYVFTLLHSGVLRIHGQVSTANIKTDKDGYIEIEKQ